MGTWIEQQLLERGHGPGQHLWEYTQGERVNAGFQRKCVGFSTIPGGCGKIESVGQTCLVCDNDGVRLGGVMLPFEVESEGAKPETGPLCQECLRDFRESREIAFVRLTDCMHDWLDARCRWCGAAAPERAPLPVR